MTLQALAIAMAARNSGGAVGTARTIAHACPLLHQTTSPPSSGPTNPFACQHTRQKSGLRANA